MHTKAHTQAVHTDFPPTTGRQRASEIRTQVTLPSRVTSRGCYRYANPLPLTLPLSHTPMHKRTYSNMLEHSHTHSYTCTNTHTHSHTYTNTHKHSPTHTHTRSNKRTHANMHVRTHVYCACVCVCLLLNCVVVVKN